MSGDVLHAGDAAESNPPVIAPEKQIALFALQTALQVSTTALEWLPFSLFLILVFIFLLLHILNQALIALVLLEDLSCDLNCIY